MPILPKKIQQPTVPTPQPPVERDRLTLGELIKLRDEVYVVAPPAEKGSLSDRFLLPPFSVLDARQGYWQTRKKMWIALGIQSELGRGDTASTSARVGPDDEATYRPIGGKKSTSDNGLLGESEQARGHYKKPNAEPGGSKRDACSLGSDGKTQRGDGRGRPLATTFGSGGLGDLAAGFKINSGAGRGDNLVAGGYSDQSINIDFYSKKRKLEAELGKTLTTDEARNILLERGEIRQKVDRTNKGKAYNRAIKDHAWPATHGKKIPQMGIETPELTNTGAENLYGAYDRDDDVSRRNAAAQPQSGTSIFDPVICELAYRWFTPVGGKVLDPFAGGSVRGVLASLLGRQYTGIDLRPEQCTANEEQGKTLCKTNYPTWITGNSLDAQEIARDEYDFVFSCPPYADLERYSDDPRDLSTMDYSEFLKVYREIIARSCAMLKDDRFACFVVGDVRNKNGNYRNFVSDTISAFRDAGLELYNDAVLVTSAGSLPMRVGSQFAGYRKLGKTHQNVLVFIKGDAGRASQACGTVDLTDLAMPEEAQKCMLAIASSDLNDVPPNENLADEVMTNPQGDVYTFDRDVVGSALVCDILRCIARRAEKTIRAWVYNDDKWELIASDKDLTYVVNGNVYLNQEVFPGAEKPNTAVKAVAMKFGRTL